MKMRGFSKKYRFSALIQVMAPKLLRLGAGRNDSGLLDIQEMTGTDSTIAAGLRGWERVFAA
tara:strand:- start:7 stop:192 length:186 start_codon:yes stop_codon:yes gene_type:complete